MRNKFFRRNHEQYVNAHSRKIPVEELIDAIDNYALLDSLEKHDITLTMNISTEHLSMDEADWYS